VKPCTTSAVCSSLAEGIAFWAHAGPKVYRGGVYNETIVAFKVLTHEAPPLSQRISLDPNRPDEILLGNSRFKRVQMMEGACQQPMP
jgi:hypothetical protein